MHFDFDLSGILTVTATEKGKGQQNSLVVDNAETGRLSSHELIQARDAISSLFDTFPISLVDAEVDTEAEDNTDAEAIDTNGDDVDTDEE